MDYLYDCASLFLLSSTALASARSSDYSSVCISFLTLVVSFCGGLLVGLLVGLHVSFLTLHDSFRGLLLIRLLAPQCLSNSASERSLLPLIDGYHYGLHDAILIEWCMGLLFNSARQRLSLWFA